MSDRSALIVVLGGFCTLEGVAIAHAIWSLRHVNRARRGARWIALFTFRPSRDALTERGWRLREGAVIWQVWALCWLMAGFYLLSR